MKLMIILHITALATVMQAQISGPVTIHNPAEIRLQSKINASAFAEQWVYAFNQLKITSGINIEIVTSKDDNVLVLDNIYKLTKSKNVVTNDGADQANLLIAVQRIDRRDYTVILDPRQIRYIRQVKADTEGP